MTYPTWWLITSNYDLQNYGCILCEICQIILNKKGLSEKNVTDNMCKISDNVSDNVSIIAANVTENVKEYAEPTADNSELWKDKSEPNIFISDNPNIFYQYEIEYRPAKHQWLISIEQV